MHQRNQSRIRPWPRIRPDLVGILLLSINLPVAAEDIDEALRGRDMSKVLEMLTPRAPDPEQPPKQAKNPLPKIANKDNQKLLPRPSQPISSLTHANGSHMRRPASTIRDVGQTTRVTRISHVLPSDLAGVPPHRVTVVSSGSILGEVDDEINSTPPSERTVLPPPGVDERRRVDPNSLQSSTGSRSPIRVGVRSEPPARIPKIQKGQTASPSAPVTRDALDEASREESEVTVIASLPTTADKPDRNKALGALQSLKESVVIVQTNSLIPDGTHTAQPPSTTQQVFATKGTEQPDVEAPERPLHLLDVLAKRFGRAPPKRNSHSLTQSAQTQRRPSTSAPKQTRPATQSPPSDDWRNNEMDEIRGTIDNMLTEADRNPSRQTDGSTTKPSPISSRVHAGQGWRYLGNWRNGKMDGGGTLTYPDGWTFDGEWREGKMHGEGTLTHPGGWIYQGGWSGGTMDGEGILTYPDGWQYIGEWRAGRMHGTGELVQAE